MALRGRKPLRNAAVLFHTVSLSTEKAVIYLFTVWYASSFKEEDKGKFCWRAVNGRGGGYLSEQSIEKLLA